MKRIVRMLIPTVKGVRMPIFGHSNHIRTESAEPDGLTVIKEAG
ncbi:hypothetical protein [Staphylospora marina]|nr:hypothetical protein [Staphylospora marina]